MWISALVVLVVLQWAAALKDDFVPMVAFDCGRPAMHMTSHGWKPDHKQDCLKDPVDILKYCRKVYPKLEVTNAVEASEGASISDWCKLDQKKCKGKTVQVKTPFRCIVGPFQSDALLVPQGCKFDHIHDREKCMKPAVLHKQAKQRCAKDGRTLKSFYWLLPCGVDLFSGVEFVCCPDPALTKEKQDPNEVAVHLHGDKKHKVVPKKGVVEKKEKKNEPLDVNIIVGHKEEVIKNLPLAKKPKSSVYAENDYTRYLNNKPMPGYTSEHDKFKTAKHGWEKDFHDKMSETMKNWAEAREQVQGLRYKDPKGAEKLSNQIQANFEKTYDALQREGEGQKRQLQRLHQTRVQKELNAKKQIFFDRFMDALDDKPQDAQEILHSLRRYVKIEQKDKLHALSHFEHLLDSDPELAEDERIKIGQHVQQVNLRVNQSLAFVKEKVSGRKQKTIMDSIVSFLGDYSDLEAAVEKALLKPRKAHPKPQVPKKKKQQKKQPMKEETPQMLHQVDMMNEADEQLFLKEVKKPKHPHQTKTKAKKSSKKTKTVIKEVEVEQVESRGFDIETDEDEHNLPYYSNMGHAAAGVQQNLVGGAVASQSHTGSVVGIVMGCVAAIVLLAAIVIAIKRRRARPAITHTFVEASPEEKHVSAMQAEGYENPTYKFFEKQQQQPIV